MQTYFPWIVTWPDDRVQDGHVPSRHLADETDVLRVFQVIGGPHNGLWYWMSSRMMPTGKDGLRRVSSQDGFCANREQAQAAAEAAYLGA